MFSDSLEQDAADGDHVGREQGEEKERHDDIESGSGSKVDEADDAGENRGEIDGVVGYVALVIHLKTIISPSLYPLDVSQ